MCYFYSFFKVAHVEIESRNPVSFGNDFMEYGVDYIETFKFPMEQLERHKLSISSNATHLTKLYIRQFAEFETTAQTCGKP
jgi:hypothetical protein